MYCGQARLSVRMPTVLHGPGLTWGSGRGCPLVVQYWADLHSVHGMRCYGNIMEMRGRAQRTHYAPAIKSTRLLRVRRYLQRGRSISSILRGVATRTRNVTEYMLVLALCLVPYSRRDNLVVCVELESYVALCIY